MRSNVRVFGRFTAITRIKLSVCPPVKIVGVALRGHPLVGSSFEITKDDHKHLARGHPLIGSRFEINQSGPRERRSSLSGYYAPNEAAATEGRPYSCSPFAPSARIMVSPPHVIYIRSGKL